MFVLVLGSIMTFLPRTPSPLLPADPFSTGLPRTQGGAPTPGTLRSNNPFTPGRNFSQPFNAHTSSTPPSQPPAPYHDAAAIFAADLTRPSVTTRMVSGTGWPAGLVLVFTEHNWGKWIEQLDMVLGISAMTGYIDGRNCIPDGNLEPRALNAYHDNNGGILAFI